MTTQAPTDGSARTTARTPVLLKFGIVLSAITCLVGLLACGVERVKDAADRLH
jgi:hypothetical protein